MGWKGFFYKRWENDPELGLGPRSYFSGCFLKQAQPHVFVIACVVTDITLLFSE